MKLNLIAGIGVVAALLCSTLAFNLAGFHYDVYSDKFVLWKATVKLGTPMILILLWFSILYVASRSQKKP